jgi:hypothetical protein
MAILGYNNRTQLIREFGLAEWLKTRGLEGWLDIATGDLAVPAKQRIASEIGAHYAEAVRAHMAAGESELSAQAIALAELGDPQEAVLNFQKSHLTAREAKQLERMERMAAKPLLSFRMLVLDILAFAGIAALFSLSRQTPNSWPNFWFLAVAWFGAYAGTRLIPRLLHVRAFPREAFLKGLVLSNLLANVTGGFAYALITYTPRHEILPAAIVLPIWGFSFTSTFRIWLKLRKMGDERNKLPPSQAAAS